jgi:RNA polymerase sigma factor (sigma-70 family)
MHPQSAGVEQIYRDHASSLRDYVRRQIARRGLREPAIGADDIVHDAFEQLIVAGPDTIENPQAWLRTVARRLLSRAHAKLGARRHHLDDVDLNGIWSCPAAREPAETIVTTRVLLDILMDLPPHQRVAVYLRHFLGRSLAEIATYLGCARSTAGVHIHRGTRKVISALESSRRLPPDRGSLSTRAIPVISALPLIIGLVAQYFVDLPWPFDTGLTGTLVGIALVLFCCAWSIVDWRQGRRAARTRETIPHPEQHRHS